MDKYSAITLITDPAFSRHDTGGGEHPEVPETLQVIAERLDQGPLAGCLQRLPSREALRSQLLTFHTEAWLFRFEEAVLCGRTYIDHPDNQVCYESYNVATSPPGPVWLALMQSNGSRMPPFFA
jgi:acetoin utilization deacetylase AcuC-like enzyme